jgi:hypothetical protein
VDLRDLGLQVGDLRLQMADAALFIRIELGLDAFDFLLHGGQPGGGGRHHAVLQIIEKAKHGLERIGGEDVAAALDEDAPANPVAQLAAGEGGEIGVGDLELGVVGVFGEEAGEFLAGVVERDFLALRFEEGLQAGQHQGGAAGGEQEPCGVAAASEDKGFGWQVVHVREVVRMGIGVGGSAERPASDVAGGEVASGDAQGDGEAGAGGDEDVAVERSLLGVEVREDGVGGSWRRGEQHEEAGGARCAGAEGNWRFQIGDL